MDEHTDFRHPGNSDKCASVAGGDLAAAVGRHWPALADSDGLGPYSPVKTVHIGCREDDEHIEEVRRSLGLALPAHHSIEIGMPETHAPLGPLLGNPTRSDAEPVAGFVGVPASVGGFTLPGQHLFL